MSWWIFRLLRKGREKVDTGPGCFVSPEPSPTGMQCNSVSSIVSSATDVVDRVRTPPPAYDDTNVPNEEDYVPEDRSILRRISQLFTLLFAIASAVFLCRHYINGQSK